MPKFPAITDKELIKKIRKIGFAFYRQAKGSHEIWAHSSDDNRAVNIPRHSGKIIKRRTLKAILEAIDISIDDFNNL